MPKIAERRKVLDGRAEVITYARDESAWYYREPDGSGGYRQRRLKDALSEVDAVAMAMDVWSEMRTTQQLITSGQVQVKPTRRTKKTSVDTSIDAFLSEERRRVDAEIISKLSLSSKEFKLRHVSEYLKWKGVTNTQEITETTFDDYLLFRKDTTKVNQRNETRVITNWLNWCKKQRQIKPDVAALKLVPTVRVRAEDLMANPPISPEDWRKIHTWIREVFIRESDRVNNHRSPYWRRCFYAFVMTGKNSGLRPKELQSLRWSDVDIISMGPRSSSDKREHLVAEISVRKTKTGEPRQVPANCGTQLAEWFQYQKEYAERHFSSSVSKIWNKNAHVFGNFYNECRPFDYTQYSRCWARVMRNLELQGHWASEKPYTLYSLRSSFVDDKLMQDTPIAVLSMMTGHDPKILMKHYSRLDVLRKSRDLTKLPIGRKKDIKKIVELF